MSRKKKQLLLPLKQINNLKLQQLLIDLEKAEEKLQPQKELRHEIKEIKEEIEFEIQVNDYEPDIYRIGDFDFTIKKYIKKIIVIDEKHIEQKDNQLSFKYKRNI